MLVEVRQPEGGPSLGMCMSLQLFRRPGLAGLFLAVGHEAGHVVVWDLGNLSAPVAVSRLHEEPVLGLVIDSDGAGVVSVRPEALPRSVDVLQEQQRRILEDLLRVIRLLMGRCRLCWAVEIRFQGLDSNGKYRRDI